MTPRSITIEYEGTLPRALGKNRGNTTHWDRLRETRSLRETAYWLLYEQLQECAWNDGEGVLPYGRGQGFLLATIRVTQYWCGKPMDVSGLASASAPLVDALMDVGVIEDDGPETVVETRYGHVQVPHRAEAKIVVTCTEVLA